MTHRLAWLAKAISGPLLVVGLSSCVFIPTLSREPPDPGCELATRELDLALIDGSDLFKETFRRYDGCVNEACLAVFAAMVTLPVGSLLVSGSLVLVGNSIHWIEAQGRCDDGVVQSLLRGMGR